MTNAQLNIRLERAKKQAAEETRAAMLRELGLESPDSLKEERERAAQLQAEREKAEREKMTREEQLAKDLEAERAKREKAEQLAAKASATATYAQQDSVITSIAIRHVDSKSRVKLEAAKLEFSKYVEGLSEAQRKRMNPQAIDRWFRRFVKQEPDFAPKAPAPQAGEAPPAPTRPRIARPVSTPNQRKPPEPGAGHRNPTITPNGKTVLPGQPNSMTAKELKEYMASKGMTKSW